MLTTPITVEHFGALQKLSNLLFGACFLIFVMIIIGGLTRLTGSGLSMVEWKPVTGWLPPLNIHDWQVLFEHYKQSPEYLKINQDMRLNDFKRIFWLEYIHRLWGRLIGIYFFLPLIVAVRTPALRSSYLPGILGLWLLGGLQGVLGWYMVKSGLVDDPHVSPHRLAAHFMLAILTYSLTLMMALYACKSYAFNTHKPVATPLPGIAILIVLISLTLFYGVLVAGHHAGLIYNTFPLMNHQWMPSEVWFLNPWYVNLIANPVTVQWLHRVFASFSLLSVFIFLAFNWSKKITSAQQRGLISMAVFVSLQFSLGLITLVYHVPLWSASLHQACAILLLSSSLFVSFASKSALTPGKVLPSSHSKKAPPAVDK